MNIKEAKQIRLVEYLRIIGHSPVNTRGCQYWYLSPLREERTPSFKVNDNLNEWYDFGLSAGGDIIELGKHLYRTGNVSVVLLRISENAIGVPFQQLQSRSVRPCPIEEEMENVEVRELSHHALLSYLRSRYISENIGRLYCKEIHYELRKRHYFAIAFENKTGGYEVRNPYYKGCIKGKDISVIRYNKDIIQNHVCVFEGFMDFLSFLTIRQQKSPGMPCTDWQDYVILNSTANVDKALYPLADYGHIHCMLDNDEAGRKAVEAIRQEYKWRVRDASHLYSGHNDLNDYLRSLKVKQSQDLTVTDKPQPEQDNRQNPGEKRKRGLRM